jgi:ABC-type bacteriocin/lantibiotic exporter with double-glycine peptidase domain
VNELYKILKDDVNLKEEHEDKNLKIKKSISYFHNEISLVNISFKYNESKSYIFKDINLKIKKSSKIAIVGSSGNGKSTLLDLILGVLKPTKGQVCYDDNDILNKKLNYQKLIGYIPQSIFLLDDSIKNNICFAVDKNEIDNQKLENAIKNSALFDYINSLPDGVETLVGERGAKLSGGQIQRIGIARALYHNPEILILDEATSALDIDMEKLIMQSILALNKEKTVIIVTHRSESVKICDQIYSISNNTIKQKVIN